MSGENVSKSSNAATKLSNEFPSIVLIDLQIVAQHTALTFSLLYSFPLSFQKYITGFYQLHQLWITVSSANSLCTETHVPRKKSVVNCSYVVERASMNSVGPGIQKPAIE